MNAGLYTFMSEQVGPINKLNKREGYIKDIKDVNEGTKDVQNQNNHIESKNVELNVTKPERYESSGVKIEDENRKGIRGVMFGLGVQQLALGSIHLHTMNHILVVPELHLLYSFWLANREWPSG